MHQQSTTTVSPLPTELVAHLPLAGRLRPATTVCAALTYERVSKSIQTSIPAQRERITKLAHMIGVPILTDLSDTGSGMRREREGYQAVLEAAESGQYSHLLLYRADRLARDSAELQGTIKRLWQLGMQVWDTSNWEITPQNLPFLALWAEMEIRILSERTDMGLEGRAKLGHKLGGIPLGYKASDVKGHPRMDDVTGPLVRELFTRVAHGESLASVMRWFAGQTGDNLSRTRLLRVLRNPYYAGVTVNFRSRKSIMEGRHARPQSDWQYGEHDAALITPELFMEVQAQLERHDNVGQHREKRSSFALQGLLWCAQCERRMAGHKRGDRGDEYLCPICHKARGLRKIEHAVQYCLSLLELCADDALEEAQALQGQRRAQLEGKMRGISQEVKRLTLRRQTLYDRLERGVIDEEQYRASVQALDSERDDWRAQEAAIRQEVTLMPAHESLAARIAVDGVDWRHWARGLDDRIIEEQQAIYRECCARITLDVAVETLTVTYTPHIALVLGRESHTVSIAGLARTQRRYD